jgi:hypothetical protein
MCYKKERRASQFVVLLGQLMELGSLGTTSGWHTFYAPSNTPIWPCIINGLSRFISQQVQQIKLQLLVKEYSPLPMHEPSTPFYWGPWRLHRSTPETSTTSPLPLSPHCQHESARWVITPLPNSSWVNVSERDLLGQGTCWVWRLKADEWVSHHPMESTIIPASWNLHSCILRRSCKSTFLHPKEEIPGLIDLPQGW